ncbi:MAG: glycosyltransferase family 4 protein [Saprospiraceae bacterium]|nr:glycosyltransferase family 4 protein [Saprospiraceae bacterium]
MKKISFIINVDWFLISHRLPIIMEAKKRNFKVSILTINTGQAHILRELGFEVVELPTSRSGLNVFNELKTLIRIISHLRKFKPNIVHNVTLKPIIYGTFAARINRVEKIVNAFSGLGYVFTNDTRTYGLHKLILFIFKLLFKSNRITFVFQNNDDIKLFLDSQILVKSQINIIKGSGIDLNQYNYIPPPLNPIVKFLLPARMLWDKGVYEFVKAASIIKKENPENFQFILAGKIDEENKAHIPLEKILEWEKDYQIKYLGFVQDMKRLIADVDVVVLPSYREGLPKSLIEACAIGRPIITTDAPGCKDVIDDGRSGIIVPVKDYLGLSKAMLSLGFDKEKRLNMGLEARKKAEKEYSIIDVIDKTFIIYEEPIS